MAYTHERYVVPIEQFSNHFLADLKRLASIVA
jgi:hypothetical protein